MKRTVIFIVSLGTILFSTAAWAASGAALFVQKCGVCHTRGGQASPVNPADKAGLVWEKYFKRGRHPVEFAQTSEAELEAVIDYLKEHAADSDQPVAAAIPK